MEGMDRKVKTVIQYDDNHANMMIMMKNVRIVIIIMVIAIIIIMLRPGQLKSTPFDF